MALEHTCINSAWFIVHWHKLIFCQQEINGELGLKQSYRISMFGKIEGWEICHRYMYLPFAICIFYVLDGHAVTVTC